MANTPVGYLRLIIAINNIYELAVINTFLTFFKAFIILNLCLISY